MDKSSLSSTSTLRCQEHHHQLIEGLWKQFSLCIGVDVQIGVGMFAHKLVLDVFLSTEKLVRISAEPDVDWSNMKSVILFVYTGQVTVYRNVMDSLLQMASSCDFQLLVDVMIEASSCDSSTAVGPTPVQQPLPANSLVHLHRNVEQPAQDTGLVTLRSYHHHDRLVNELQKRFLLGDEVDINIGQQVFAHRLVLDIFMSPERLVFHSQHYFFKRMCLKAMIKFLYTGRLIVKRSQMLTLSKLAICCDFHLLVNELDKAFGKKSLARDRAAIRHLSLVQQPNLVQPEAGGSSDQQHPGARPDAYVLGHRVEKIFAVPLMVASGGDGRLREHPQGDSVDSAVNVGIMEYVIVEFVDKTVPANTAVETASLKDTSVASTSGYKDGSVVLVNAEMQPALSIGVSVNSFLGAFKFKSHSWTHMAKQLNICEFCGQRFEDKARWVIHQRKHTVKPFSCSKCSLHFASSFEHVCHLMTHTGERLFKCKFCGAAFTTEEFKSIHEEIHSTIYW